MSDVHEESTYTFAELRDKVVLDLPDNSVKEHLSIVNCGHDVGSGDEKRGQVMSDTNDLTEQLHTVPDTDDKFIGLVLFDLVHYAMAAFGGAACCSVTHSGATPIDIVNSQMQLKPAKYTSIITVDKNNISAEGSGALLTDETTMQKVTKAIRQNLGTSPSEMSKDVVLTLSLVFDSAIVVVSPTECPDSEFNPESCLKDPKRMRSNTTNAGDLEKSVFLYAILPGVCPACPRILTTSPNERQIRSVQQSHGKFVGIEYNTEEKDDMLEENYMTVYMKMINGKTISIKYHRHMTAAVISDEVERRSLIPRHDSPGTKVKC